MARAARTGDDEGPAGPDGASGIAFGPTGPTWVIGAQPPRNRRRITFLAITGLVVVGYVAWAVFFVGTSSWHTDRAELRRTRHRLLLVERNELPRSVMGATPGHPTVGGCRVDSGDLFQPSLIQSWTAKRRSAPLRPVAVMAGFLARGWASGPSLSDGDAVFELDHPHWQARAVVYAESSHRIGVEVTIHGAHPCTPA